MVKKFEIYHKYNILYSESINIYTREKEIYGSVEELPYKGLYLSLLGTKDKADDLLCLVSEGTEPYTWKQGNLTALIFKDDIKVVCMFYCSDKKGLEAFEYSNQIYEEYKKIHN